MNKNYSFERELTYEYISSRLSYDPDSGIIRWVKSGVGKCKAGQVAGWMASGYVSITVKGRAIKAHRIAWMLSYGSWPNLEIDHIDGDRMNNRISNLRECSRLENMQNLRKYKASSGKPMSSKYIGVHFHKQSGKWMARIRNAGSRVVIGMFENEDEAGQAYLKAKAELHTFNPIPRDID